MKMTDLELKGPQLNKINLADLLESNNKHLCHIDKTICFHLIQLLSRWCDVCSYYVSGVPGVFSVLSCPRRGDHPADDGPSKLSVWCECYRPERPHQGERGDSDCREGNCSNQPQTDTYIFYRLYSDIISHSHILIFFYSSVCCTFFIICVDFVVIFTQV